MSMNIFRLAGDMCHVLSNLLFLHLVAKRRNGSGISCRSQELYLAVFCLRYLDIFTTFYSLYNSVLKIFFVSVTVTIIYYLRFVEPTCSTYSRNLDADPALSAKRLVLPAVLVGTIVHFFGSGRYGFDLVEWLWSISIVLEAVAMLPQLSMFGKNRNAAKLVQLAIGLMGSYRFLYILNWIYRANYEPHYQHHYLVYLCGTYQVLIYSDFFAFHFGCDLKAYWIATEEETTALDVQPSDGNSESGLAVFGSAVTEILAEYTKFAKAGSAEEEASWEPTDPLLPPRDETEQSEEVSTTLSDEAKPEVGQAEGQDGDNKRVEETEKQPEIQAV